MTTSRDTPNPLRPYYRPPSIGIPQDTPGTTSSGAHSLGSRNGNAASYASSAREIFSDIDYTDYLSDSSPTALESVKKQVDNWFYRYMSILLAQPFDVAKTVLQVRSHTLVEEVIPATDRPISIRSSYRDSMYNDYPSDDSDADEPAYFTSTAPSATSYSPTRRRRRTSDPASPPPRLPAAVTQQLLLRNSDSIMEVISQEWTKEGAGGVWKASNATFVYGVLLQTIEKWSRGFISAIFNVPDTLSVGLESTTDFAGSPYPWASLGVAISAAVVAGIILAPFDLIRTKLIVTPTSTPKRSLTGQIRLLNSYICSTSLILPTILHSLITPAMSHSTPLILRSRLAIDPVLTPNAYQLATFLSRTAELFIKLPFETVLRRAQISTLRHEIEVSRTNGKWEGDLETVVSVGDYRGLLGTMWWIVREEGVRRVPVIKGKNSNAKDQKGQGLPGLWRGWKVGIWGLAGMWASRALNGGVVAGEF